MTQNVVLQLGMKKFLMCFNEVALDFWMGSDIWDKGS